jgi:hypothetical protein
MRRIAAGLVVPLALAACGSGPPPAAEPPVTSPDPPAGAEPAPAPLYEVSAMVLENERQGPMLCLGAILTSLPPQCGNVPITNWDWREVKDEERLMGTTTGSYHLVGRYDGETFTVEEIGPFDEALRPPDGSYPKATSPCREPEGGWVGLEGATQEEASAAHAYARKQADYVSSWVTHLEPELLEFSPVLVNVVFTDHVERHEAELRKLWPGPLCAVERDVPTARELRRVRRQVEGSLEELGLQMLWSSGPDLEPVIQLGVVADPGGRAQDALDSRYGAGLVRIYRALRPKAPA